MTEESHGIISILRLDLIDAAGAGRLDKVRTILDEHANLINWVDESGGRHGEHGRTALWAAVSHQHGHADVVKLLLERGASVDAHDAKLNGWYVPEGGGSKAEEATLLHRAASTGNVDVIRLLVEHGLSVLETDELGQGPLHAAALGTGNAEAIEALLELGADPTQADIHGLVPLHTASEERSVAALLAAGAQPDPAGPEAWPLYRAIRYGRPGIARLLIEAGADPHRLDSQGRNLLQIAAYASRADALRLLLDLGLAANSVEGDLAPLHRSLQRGHVEGVEILLAAGATVTDDSLNHLSWTWGESSIRCAELLVGAGADPRSQQEGQKSPLHRAAGAGLAAGVDFLLAHGMEVDITDSFGRTPLMEACQGGYPNAVERLLKAGANPVAKANDGETPWSLTKVSGVGRDIKRQLEKHLPKKSPAKSSPPSPPEWSAGDAVHHTKFGNGVIVETMGSGDQLKATVDFESGGTKQMLGRFLKRP